MSDHCVEFEHVVKAYESFEVIRDLTLALPANTTTALVGESGSGKSTLLQIINGLVVPDSGVVRVSGDALDYTDLPRLRRRMGYAVQGGGLFPHLTLRENVTLMARLEGWSAADTKQRFDYLRDLLELDPSLGDRYPHSLSGGQQQRGSLCRAMMLNPPLLLLDEPFSALDPITRDTIHQEFQRLAAAESRSIVLVTHDMSEAVKLASYLVVLRDGEVVQAGAINEVRANPADDYVTRLFSVAGVA